MIELFSFEEQFSAGSRVYVLSLKIPDASLILAMFEQDTESKITDQIEEDLLKMFDALFKEGRFIFLYDFIEDEELADEINDAVLEFCNSKKPSDLLGTWDYSRNAKNVLLRWNTPEWFKRESGRCHIDDYGPIRSICKDWFINCVPYTE